MSFAAAAAALLIERVTGYPAAIYRTIGHPVEWIGRLIGYLEGKLNRPEAPALQGRLRGLICLALLLAVTLARAGPLRW
jgi:adenosylcobinamide-phosphate synthase